jgi:hypothetical protein
MNRNEFIKKFKEGDQITNDIRGQYDPVTIDYIGRHRIMASEVMGSEISLPIDSDWEKLPNKMVALNDNQRFVRDQIASLSERLSDISKTVDALVSYLGVHIGKDDSLMYSATKIKF